VVKCTKCYAINKPEAKFCGSCGQTLVQTGQRTGQNTPSRPVYTPPVRPTYTSPARDFSAKPSYNLPARVTPPSMPSRITAPAPSLPEIKKKWSTDDEEEDFALAAINESEHDNFAAPADTHDSYAVEVAEENDNDAYHLTEDFKKEVLPSDVRDERPVADTKGSYINILSRLFSGDRNLMDMFIIQEIMTPQRFKRK